MVEQESDELQSESEQDDLPGAGATAPPSKEDELSNLDRAKAFMRALYSGGDVKPEDFGFKDDGQAGAACKSCEGLEKQLQEASQKGNEAEGLYRRMAADFENYRRRIDREREEFQALGMKKVIEAILPALDDLDRAQASLSSNLSAEKIIESMKVVCNSLNRSLEQVGVKQLSVIGEQFDPRLHEPVQQIETDEFPDNAVMHELRKGYTLNEKVVRPALVNVAQGKSESDQAKPAKQAEAKVIDSKNASANNADTKTADPKNATQGSEFFVQDEKKVLNEEVPPTIYDLGDEEQYDQPVELGAEEAADNE